MFLFAWKGGWIWRKGSRCGGRQGVSARGLRCGVFGRSHQSKDGQSEREEIFRQSRCRLLYVLLHFPEQHLLVWPSGFLSYLYVTWAGFLTGITLITWEIHITRKQQFLVNNNQSLMRRDILDWFKSVCMFNTLWKLTLKKFDKSFLN